MRYALRPHVIERIGSMLSRRARRTALVIVTVLALSGFGPDGVRDASAATSPYYTGYSQASSSGRTWSQWAYVYFSNDTSSGIQLNETSQWVRLDSSGSNVIFGVTNLVESPGDYDSFFDDVYLDSGYSENYRWDYPLPNGGSGKTYYKSGNEVHVAIGSGQNNWTRLLVHVYFGPSYACHITTGGAITLLSGTSTC